MAVSESWAPVLLGAGVGALVGASAILWPVGPLVRENYAGRPVPVMLGFALVAGTAFGFLVGRPGAERPAVEVVAVASLGGLFLAGLADDAAAGGPRGLAGHLRSLSRGRPTTGILKLAVGVAAGVAAALAAGGPPVRLVAGAVLVAASVNLLNALDLRPGRALKWGLLVLVATLPTLWGTGTGALVGAGTGAALGVLPYDLRERGMLGDAGSNPLGFLAGLGLLLVLSTPLLVVAAVIAVGLQVVAETVTFSSVIGATPPLAWFDRLGRRSG
jgi:hypothetical protein